MLLVRDGLRSVEGFEPELIHLLLEEGLAGVSTFRGGKLEEELFVAFDDDGETVVAEAEGFLGLESDDVLDGDDHLRRKTKVSHEDEEEQRGEESQTNSRLVE